VSVDDRDRASMVARPTYRRSAAAASRKARRRSCHDRARGSPPRARGWRFQAALTCGRLLQRLVSQALGSQRH
jgi:hypothetical protein